MDLIRERSRFGGFSMAPNYRCITEPISACRCSRVSWEELGPRGPQLEHHHHHLRSRRRHRAAPRTPQAQAQAKRGGRRDKNGSVPATASPSGPSARQLAAPVSLSGPKGLS